MIEQGKNSNQPEKLISRRNFLCSIAASAATFAIGTYCAKGDTNDAPSISGLDFPLIDFHVHLERGITLEKAIQLSNKRGVKFGIAEHGGFRQIIDGDDALKRYFESLEGHPIYKGMQAEGLDWMKCFSKDAVAQLDYVLSDALTFPEKDGRLVRLWTPKVKIEEKQDFMDRYVDFNVLVISSEPIDIIANPTFLPLSIADEYDILWTEERSKKIIEAAVKYEVAIEINSRYNIPSAAFIRMAKSAGVKFSFGSNYHDENIGRLDYCLKMAKECGLTQKDMFMPKPYGMKPIQKRTFYS